jgi:hypothetical protein
MGRTHTVERGLGRPVSRRGLLLWLAVASAWVLVAAVPAAAPAAGCVVTFRHGDVVRADRCEDAGVAVAYVRFGGWVVVPKATLVSVAGETGVTKFFTPWSPAETRAQVQALPREGGVPIGPTSAEGPPLLASQPPQVIYVPVPTAEPPQPDYEVASPYYGYPYPVGICRHCSRRHPGGVRPPFVRGVPTNRPSTGPMAIQNSLPPISRTR